MNPVIAQAEVFTDTYKQYKDAPIAIREGMCFKAQYPALLSAIQPGDLYAGRRPKKRIAYLGSIMWFGLPDYTPEHQIMGKQGGYCFDFSAAYVMAQTEEEKQVLEALTAFWKTESNMAKVRTQTPIKESVGFLVAHDLDRLVKKGLPGLMEDINAMPESDFRTGMRLVLETIADVCRFYQKQAEEQGNLAMAHNLAALTAHAPATLAEALQLIFLIEMLSHERHYENNRFDVALGDVYVQNLADGVITEEQAIEQIRAFYQMVNECGEVTVCRLMMGGKGRRNEANADRFIEAALYAEQRHKKVTPQVSLRIYDGMNPKLLQLAYDTINETYTFPTLYNDDVIIDGVAKAFGISAQAAEEYYPLGCGEYMIAHSSPSILCASWNIPETVTRGLRACMGSAQNFEDLYQSVLEQIKKKAADLAYYHRIVIDTHNTQNAFLMASLLTHDCLQNGKPILNGGARYLGACIMGHGFTNAADALTAIKMLVYDNAVYSLNEILQATDANFEGYESIHKALLDAPKYGNDHDEADGLLIRLWNDLNVETAKAGQACGLDFFTISSVNPGGYHMGTLTGATADGRHKGEAFAIGNAPTAGFDKSGLTALMNSILKTDPANGGATTNFKISRAFFTHEREKFESLFAAYWAGGGLQANITIVNRGDLEAALQTPEKYPHLLVRLGGWTARFIDLERHIQMEILQRTLY